MSNIEWTQKTWNPFAGCRTFNGVTRLDEAALTIPLKVKKPTTWFVNSMSDVFHDGFSFEQIDRVWAVMALCPQHTFQVLTKRPERMAEYLLTRTAMDDSGRVDRSPQWYHEITRLLDEGEAGTLGRSWDRCHEAASNLDLTRPLPNVWIGTSCEDQQRANERIPHLLKCPAAARFLSLEPLLGPIELSPWVPCAQRDFGHDTAGLGISWVIVGGESGPNARLCKIEWIRSIVEQCKGAGVPAFVKQLGAKFTSSNGFDRQPTWKGHWTSYEKRMNLPAQYWTANDRKGGDMAEFPDDLRVRQMPGKAEV